MVLLNVFAKDLCEVNSRLGPCSKELMGQEFVAVLVFSARLSARHVMSGLDTILWTKTMPKMLAVISIRSSILCSLTYLVPPERAGKSRK